MRTKLEIKHLVLGVILLIGAAFRFTGLNWDQGHNLHPDERFLVMVGTGITWPKNFLEYLDTTKSPLNPHNKGFNFYVYGTWPVVLVKFVSQIISKSGFDDFMLVGRHISALLDVIVVLIIFMLSKKIWKSWSVGVVSALLYSTFVLPIQLSHFFAVDTFMVCFFYVSLFIVHHWGTKLKKDLAIDALLGAAAGLSASLSVSSKVSSIALSPFLVMIMLAGALKIKSKLRVTIFLSALILSGLVSFRFLQPYLFVGGVLPSGINQAVINNWKELKSYEREDVWFPPSVLWLSSTKILFPLKNMLLLGLGIPASVIILLGVVFIIKNPKPNLLSVFLLVTTTTIFLYQGTRFALPLRYFYPIYPMLAILGGGGLLMINKARNFWPLISLFILSWPFFFVTIYTRPHSRVQASGWIFKNIPSGSVVSCEYWDDCLPLHLSAEKSNSDYQIVQLSLYDPESANKWQKINSILSGVEYLILSSNRLYGSITGASQKYPQTSKFYRDLFGGRTNFKKIAEFTSRPGLPFFKNICVPLPFMNYGVVSEPINCIDLGVWIIDDFSDETFTVYDHPKVTIFKNMSISPIWLP